MYSLSFLKITRHFPVTVSRTSLAHTLIASPFRQSRQKVDRIRRNYPSTLNGSASFVYISQCVKPTHSLFESVPPSRQTLPYLLLGILSPVLPADNPSFRMHKIKSSASPTSVQSKGAGTKPKVRPLNSLSQIS